MAALDLPETVQPLLNKRGLSAHTNNAIDCVASPVALAEQRRPGLETCSAGDCKQGVVSCAQESGRTAVLRRENSGAHLTVCNVYETHDATDLRLRSAP